MGMTVTEKILSGHAGKPSVRTGENVWVNVDILLTHDICGPATIGIFQQEFGPNAKVWDREKVIILPDHYIFTADPMAHRNIETLREFAAQQKLPYFYDADFVKGSGIPAPYASPSATPYKGV
jgi:3-isopropylmalate/(R)-2-methylmalate dehydratase large subunit